LDNASTISKGDTVEVRFTGKVVDVYSSGGVVDVANPAGGTNSVPVSTVRLVSKAIPQEPKTKTVVDRVYKDGGSNRYLRLNDGWHMIHNDMVGLPAYSWESLHRDVVSVDVLS
jgi:hypothetical protein